MNGITTYSDKPCPDGIGEHNIDALTKQGQPPDMQAFLEARRQQKRNEQFRYRC